MISPRAVLHVSSVGCGMRAEHGAGLGRLLYNKPMELTRLTLEPSSPHMPQCGPAPAGARRHQGGAQLIGEPLYSTEQDAGSAQGRRALKVAVS